MGTERSGDLPADVAASRRYFWATGRPIGRVLDNKYMFYREVYGLLHTVLIEEAVRPFRFVDVACGDAGATALAFLLPDAKCRWRGNSGAPIPTKWCSNH